ncbi:MAG: ROK family transcriptional regulator [Bacteroidales bacterium]|nr:ROK family transcriptional regulator [Bacteroidales bacterium]
MPDKNANTKKEILRLTIENGSYCIADYSREMGISVPTVTKLVEELVSDGILQDEGKVGTSGGRRPNSYGLNPDAGYFLGIDVGRRHFHIAVTDFKGQVVKHIEDIAFVLEANADSFRTICRRTIDEVVGAGIPWIKVFAVGISLSGRVNPEKGYSLTYSVSDDIPMLDLFRKELNVPVSIENDSRAMAYGEYMHLGKAADKNMVFINLSWGLGMGMILDGKLYYGKSGFSGEIGHFPLLDNDIICRCGKVGCLETGASGSALRRYLEEKLREGRQSSLSAIFEKKGEIELEEILQAIREEDVLAIEGIGKIGETLGRGIAGILNIFNPGMIVIGGTLTVGKDYLMLPIKTAVNKMSLHRVSSDTKILTSDLGRYAAVFGDCLLARAKMLDIL